MTNQEFHGDVKQVAGRDVNNYIYEEKTLWNCTLEELRNERTFSRAQKWKLQRKLLFSLPTILLIIGALILLVNIIYGPWSFMVFGREIHVWSFGGGAIFSAAILFSILIDQTKRGIAFHTRQLEAIETVIQAKF